MASAIFEEAYGEIDFRGSATLVFTGGLTDSRTGRDLPAEITARYQVSGKETRQIDWSDEDAIEFGINWSMYRKYRDPTIKNDDCDVIPKIVQQLYQSPIASSI